MVPQLHDTLISLLRPALSEPEGGAQSCELPSSVPGPAEIPAAGTETASSVPAAESERGENIFNDAEEIGKEAVGGDGIGTSGRAGGERLELRLPYGKSRSGMQRSGTRSLITSEQWVQLYKLAAKHNVQGLLQETLAAATNSVAPPAELGHLAPAAAHPAECPAAAHPAECPAAAHPADLSQLPLPVAARLLNDSMMIAASHRKHRATAGKLAEIWKQNGIEARMIKGLESAKYYPHPEARVLGDIDWWITKPEDWDKAVTAVKNLGLKLKLDSDGDVSFEYDGIVIELHHKGLKSNNPEAELQLLADHVLHHATVFGAELRNICDYAVARHRLGYDAKSDAIHDVKSTLLQQGEVRQPTPSDNLLQPSTDSRWQRALDSLSDYIILGTAPSKDAEQLLEMTLGGSNEMERAKYFLRVAPGAYLSRLAGLVAGRLRRLTLRRE